MSYPVESCLLLAPHDALFHLVTPSISTASFTARVIRATNAVCTQVNGLAAQSTGIHFTQRAENDGVTYLSVVLRSALVKHVRDHFFQALHAFTSDVLMMFPEEN